MTELNKNLKSEAGMSLVSIMVAIGIFGIILVITNNYFQSSQILYEYQEATEVRQELLGRYSSILKKKGIRKKTVFNWSNLSLYGWAVNGVGKFPTNTKQEMAVFDDDGTILIPKEGLKFDKVGRKITGDQYAYKIMPYWKPLPDGNYELAVDLQTNPAVVNPSASSKTMSSRTLNSSKTECHVYQGSKVLGKQVSNSFNILKPFKHQLKDSDLTISTVSCPATMIPVAVSVEGGCNATKQHYSVSGNQASCLQQTGKIPDHPNCTKWTDMGFTTTEVYGISCFVTCCRFGT